YELRAKFVITSGSIPPIISKHDSRITPIATLVGVGPVSSGSISLSTTGGSGGYSYSWTGTSSTTSVVNNLTENTYSVTVTDSEGRSATKTYALGKIPSWSNLVNVTNSAGTLTRTGPTEPVLGGAILASKFTGDG